MSEQQNPANESQRYLEPSAKRRVVVITGGSAGIGRATAERFARDGAALGLIARDEAALADTRGELQALGAEVSIFAADVANADAVFAAAANIEAALGPIDVWINSAMVTVYSPVAEMTPKEFQRVTEVTYLGAVYGTMAALKTMRPRNRGTIIQVGSVHAYRGMPLLAAHCGAKHALRGFTDSLRTELQHDGSNINLSMVQLPAVNTPQFDWARSHLDHAPRPTPPVAQPEAAAEAIFRTVQSPTRETWLGFDTLRVIFGSLLAPASTDRYLARTAYRAQEQSGVIPIDRHDNLDQPVHGLHHSRGSFDTKARGSALVVSESGARFGAAFLGAGLLMAAGALARRATQTHRRH